MSTSHGWARGLSCSTSTANQQLACTTLMFKHEYRVHQGIVDMRLETSEMRYSEIRNFGTDFRKLSNPFDFHSETETFPGYFG